MKHKILFFLFVCFTLASCIDDDIVDSCGDITDDIEVPDYLKNGYSLNLRVTLDKMGGTRRSATTAELEAIESYINPEKFRVLFFDHEDKFLFESKSRWIKMLTSVDMGNPKEAEWLVSVPLFTYGNDMYEDTDENGNKIILEWPWEKIKKALQDNNFKIAILANRHDYEWYPGFSNTGLGNTAGWIDNTGPHWTPKDVGEVTIFDLHHCQYDAVYHGKSAANNGVGDFYDFIAKDYKKKEDGTDATDYADYRPQMGATSSWADWDYETPCSWITEGKETDNNGTKTWTTATKVGSVNNNDKGWVTINSSKKDNVTTITRRTIKRFRHPSQNHPIPMYGVQRFDKIEGWSQGTPFNLSKFTNSNSDYAYKNISLLRSVVKLELLIPKIDKEQDEDEGKPEIVALCYPNIYARCEPMDVWTPTDELWDSQHPNGFATNTKCKDMEALLNYGPVATAFTGNAKIAYQKKISWFYGVWREDKTGTPDNKKGTNPWWKFEPFDMSNFVAETPSTPYPRIFNSYIQRNNVMICDDNVLVEDPKYWHYVIYTGERNMLDPSSLGNMGNTGSGQPTVMYWVFERKGKLYNLPITDYNNMSNIVYDYLAPQEKKYILSDENEYDPSKKDNHEKFMVIGGLDNMNGTGSGSSLVPKYSQAIMTETDPANRPWPLIRNHVYTLTLTTTDDIPLYTHEWDFTKMSDSDDDIKNIKTDGNWVQDSKTWITYYNNYTVSGKLSANSTRIEAAVDLKFNAAAKGVNFEKVYDDGSGTLQYYLRLDKNATITFPKMKKGQTITIVGQYPATAGKEETRTFKISPATSLELIEGTANADGNYDISGKGGNGTANSGNNTNNPLYTFKWRAKDNVNVELSIPGSGLAFIKFIIEDENASAKSARAAGNRLGFKIKVEDNHSKSIRFD